MSDMEDLLYFDEVGEHGHKLLRSAGETAASGMHGHVWFIENEIMLSDDDDKIPEKSLLMSDFDGAHSHPLDGDRTRMDSGAHRHGVRVSYKKMIATEMDGGHDHLLLVASTGSVGPHSHTIELGGQRLTSLMPADFLRLLGEAEMEEAEEPVMRANANGAAIYLKGERLCAHDSIEEAGKCMAARTLLIRSGIAARVNHENLHASAWLVKAGINRIAKARLTELKGELGGRLARAMETLGRE